MQAQDGPTGRGASMLSGLVFMQTDGKGNITAVWDDDVDSDDLDDIMDEKAYNDVPAYAYSDPMTSLYYFGGTDNEDADGSLKTGNVTVNLDVGAAGVKVMKIDSVKLRNEADPLGQNKKGDSVEGLVTEGARPGRASII